MSPDEHNTAQPAPGPAYDVTPSTPEPEMPPAVGEAWADVVRRMDELGAAIARWGVAARHDPQVKKHADELSAQFKAMGNKVGEVVDDVAQSDFGQQVTEAADKAGAAIGEGVDKFGKAAAPHVSSAFTSISDALNKAAQSLDKALAKEPAESGDPAAPTQAPAPPNPPAEPPSQD